MFKCINTNNEVRTFGTYAEALRFVLREGDKSRLWSLETDDKDERDAAEYETRCGVEN